MIHRALLKNSFANMEKHLFLTWADLTVSIYLYLTPVQFDKVTLVIAILRGVYTAGGHCIQ